MVKKKKQKKKKKVKIKTKPRNLFKHSKKIRSRRIGKLIFDGLYLITLLIGIIYFLTK